MPVGCILTAAVATTRCQYRGLCPGGSLSEGELCPERVFVLRGSLCRGIFLKWVFVQEGWGGSVRRGSLSGGSLSRMIFLRERGVGCTGALCSGDLPPERGSLFREGEFVQRGGLCPEEGLPVQREVSVHGIFLYRGSSTSRWTDKRLWKHYPCGR